ncbi:MAG: AAA family ATPase [Candidatus Peribacteria bacterium]|nr:MAG: AAA family ATPase [Candidatus Peribacteria bacterium]
MQTHDILLFYGARQVGKTTLMKILEKDYIKQQSYFFDLENPDYLQLLNQNPNIFVEYLISYHGRDKQTPIVVFIDEVQYLNNPTNFLKYIYDNYPSIKLIVS